MRVVLDSHGFTDSPRRHTARSGISEAITQSGSISVALGGSRGEHILPLPLTRSHDGMEAPDGSRFKDADGAALVKFLLRHVEKTVAQYARAQRLPHVPLDMKRTVAVGFSNGGALSTALAAKGVVSHAISFSGPTPTSIAKPNGIAGKTNVIFVAGELDPVIPPNGPHAITHPSFLPVNEAARVFLESNGVTSRMSNKHLPGVLAAFAQPGVEVKGKRTKDGHLVGVIRIADNGHAVPGSAPFISRKADDEIGFQSSPKVSGAKLVTEFLRYLDEEGPKETRAPAVKA